MSKVTQVTARYGRSVQPKPYESKESLLEAVIVADEGEDVSRAEVEALFSDLIANVHAALDLPMVAVDVANSTDELPKKTRKTRAKKGSKAPEQVPDNGGGLETATADEVPVEGDEKDDTATAADVVTAVDEGVSDQELQSAAAGAAAKHGAAKVKELMKEFDVTLLGKLDQPKRLEFLSKLDELNA